MAKLAAVVESLDAVPEAAREFYTEQDGKYVLDAEVEAHPGTAALKGALQKERGERKQSSTRVSQLEQEIADLKSKIEERGDRGGNTDSLEKLLQKRETELRKEFDPILKERDQLKADMATRERRTLIEGAARKAKILPDRFEDALLAADRYIRIENGKAQVFDEDGDPTGMSLEKFFGEWFREKKPWLYDGTGSTGGGARPGATPTTPGTVTLTADEASNYQTYQAALEKVGGDHSRIKVASA